MNQAEAAHSLLVELKRLRAEGVREIYVEEESLRALEEALADGSVRPGEGGKHDDEALEGPPSAPSPSDRQTKTAKADSVRPESSAVRAFAEESRPSLPDPEPFELPEGSKQERRDWLRDRVLQCPTCLSELNPGGQVVFGAGDLDADLFLCGEAPGAEEERQGEPFVGPAGELLDKILEAMGFPRESVYVGNILNWRPRHNQAYGNRPPTLEEMNFCLPYLKAQLEIVSPKVVVALGKTATDGLLGADPGRRLADVRGQWNEFEGIPLMVTYHPSYLLHNPSKASKRKVWQDMLLVMEKLGLEISERQRGFFS